MKKHKSTYHLSFVKCWRAVGYGPGEVHPDNVVHGWVNTTCKNCLRHRPERKGKS